MCVHVLSTNASLYACGSRKTLTTDMWPERQLLTSGSHPVAAHVAQQPARDVYLSWRNNSACHLVSAARLGVASAFIGALAVPAKASQLPS